MPLSRRTPSRVGTFRAISPPSWDRSVTVAPEATLSEAATVMAEQRKKILPVVEGERLAGVITRMDILTLHVLNPQL